MQSLDDLLREADERPFAGWDFTFLDGRLEQSPAAWDYELIVTDRMQTPVVDLGTGGGEFFATLAPYGGLAVATEAWPPNVPIAQRVLRAAGAHVVQVEPAPDNDEWSGTGGRLPFRDASVSLVVNRHEAFSPVEVARILRPGGRFVTQQIGADNDAELRELYATSPRYGLSVGVLTDQCAGAGLTVSDAREDRPLKVFRDAGAVAWYMKALEFDFPGFDIRASRDLLAGIDRRIRADGGLEVHEHLVLVEAVKP